MPGAGWADRWAPEPGWLDTASYGLPPLAAYDAVRAALADWRGGRTSWEVWDTSTGLARESFARLVGVPVDRVAVGSAVSHFLGLVAAALPAGATVVVPDAEFTSNLFPWLVQEGRDVEVRAVPLDRLADEIGPGTSVVAFSAVQSSSGALAAVDDILAAARAVDALVVVDATQAVGWLPFDASRFDVVACAAYKWLMAPRGAAFMTVGDRAEALLTPVSAGWYAGEDVPTSYYGPPLRLARTARRFDLSPAWFAWVGAAPALATLEEIGVERVHAHDVALANRFRTGLGMPASDSAIVSATVPDARERLTRAGIRAATRAGALRASFHAYTTEQDVDAALDALVG